MSFKLGPNGPCPVVFDQLTAKTLRNSCTVNCLWKCLRGENIDKKKHLYTYNIINAFVMCTDYGWKPVCIIHPGGEYHFI